MTETFTYDAKENTIISVDTRATSSIFNGTIDGNIKIGHPTAKVLITVEPNASIILTNPRYIAGLKFRYNMIILVLILILCILFYTINL